MEFINTEQRDPSANEILHPHCCKDKAIKIISKYEKCREMVQQGELVIQSHLGTVNNAKCESLSTRSNLSLWHIKTSDDARFLLIR